MPEHVKVQEAIQKDDGASSVDATANATAATIIREAAIDAEADHDTTAKGPGTLIAEARRYRKRAQAAEQSLEEAKAQLAEREAAIGEHQHTIAALQRKQAIDEALRQSGAMDFDVARTLTEREISQNAALDPAAAVQELQRSKPYLFRQARRAMSTGVQCPRSNEGETSREQRLARAAEDAHSSGKRGDVLRYLRLRRNR